MNKLVAAAMLLAVSSVAQAVPVYTYSTNDLGGDILSGMPPGGVNPNGGNVSRLETSFDAGTEDFTWEYDATAGAGGADNAGFWLVVSDGPNPKGGVDEYAILYGDVAAQRVSAFVYSGTNSSSSYSSPGIHLQTFENALTATKDAVTGITTVSLGINATGINSYSSSADWDGVAFGEKLGIWFHPIVQRNPANPSFGYTNVSGVNVLTSFNNYRGGWYDTNGSLTTEVPEPAPLALMLIGALGLVARRGLQNR